MGPVLAVMESFFSLRRRTAPFDCGMSRGRPLWSATEATPTLSGTLLSGQSVCVCLCVERLLRSSYHTTSDFIVYLFHTQSC